MGGNDNAASQIQKKFLKKGGKANYKMVIYYKQCFSRRGHFLKV